MAKRFSFQDWYVSFTDIRCILDSALSYMKNYDVANLLIVGCGNSKLPEEIHDYLGYRYITSIDLSKQIIMDMARHYEKDGKWRAGLLWEAMDVCDLKFDAECKDCIIDKGTFDTILCDKYSGPQQARRMLKEISRVLKPYPSTFILISHSGPEHRLKYLQRAKYKWAVSHQAVSMSKEAILTKVLREKVPSDNIEDTVINSKIVEKAILDSKCTSLLMNYAFSARCICL